MDIVYIRGSWASRRDPYHIYDLNSEPHIATASYGGGKTILKSRPLTLSMCSRATVIHKDEIDDHTGKSFFEKDGNYDIYDGIPEDMMICGHCLKKYHKLT